MNNHHLSDEQRLFIVVARKNHIFYSNLKDQFLEEFGRRIYNSTISGVMNKMEETGDVADRPRPGKPSSFDEREERYMAREALKLPFPSLRDLAADPHYNPKRVTKDTIHRVLREADISSFILPKRLTDLTVGSR